MKHDTNIKKVQLSTLYGKMNGGHVHSDVTTDDDNSKNVYTDTDSIIFDVSDLYPSIMKEGKE